MRRILASVTRLAAPHGSFYGDLSRKGEAVEVLRMAVEDACEHKMFVQIRWQGRKMAVPLSQLVANRCLTQNAKRDPNLHGQISRGGSRASTGAG
jgi:hypothetical protein